MVPYFRVFLCRSCGTRSSRRFYVLNHWTRVALDRHSGFMIKITIRNALCTRTSCRFIKRIISRILAASNLARLWAPHMYGRMWTGPATISTSLRRKEHLAGLCGCVMLVISLAVCFAHRLSLYKHSRASKMDDSPGSRSQVHR